jgi:mannosylfructose-phosphate synthase
MKTDVLRAGSGLPRIAMISTHGYVAAQPPLGAADTGGQVVYVLELSRKIAQLGFEVDIWTRRFDDQPELEPMTEQVRIIRQPCGGSGFIPKEYLHERLPQWCENALRFVKRHRLRYDFLNSHYWDGGVAGQYISDVLDIPHLHTPHSLGAWKKKQMEADFPGDAANLEARYKFSRRITAERLLYSSAEIVLATTPQQLDILEQEYEVPPEKCRLLPAGYDDTRFFPVSESSRRAIRQRLGFGTSTVMAIGRLARNKGYDLLLHGFSVVAARDPNALLYLAVGGITQSASELQALQELKEIAAGLGLSERVRFGDYVADGDLADFYRAADVFVLSSRYEPFGMTAIEAMACGTPTVVTIHGGLFRALTFGRHALYADPFDKQDLGMMIYKVLRHPRLRARLARMGAHKCRSLFAWTGVAQQLVALAERRASETFTLSDNEWDEPWNDSD